MTFIFLHSQKSKLNFKKQIHFQVKNNYKPIENKKFKILFGN